MGFGADVDDNIISNSLMIYQILLKYNLKEISDQFFKNYSVVLLLGIQVHGFLFSIITVSRERLTDERGICSP